jgi:hypothetical protein
MMQIFPSCSRGQFQDNLLLNVVRVLVLVNEDIANSLCDLVGDQGVVQEVIGDFLESGKADAIFP